VFTVRVSLAPVRPTAVPTVSPDRPAGIRLVTGEAIVMDIRIARLGSRMLARLLDLCLQVAIGWILSFVLILLVTLSGAGDQASIAAVSVVTVVVTLVGYPVLMETLTRGRTVGKLALGLRVVRDDGGPIRFRQALARTLVGVSAEFPGVLPPLTWFACIGTMLANPEGKRLGDIAAGTIVIHERTPETWGWVPAMPPQLAAWASTLDLTGVNDQLALAVRNYLARNRKLREPARSRLGAQLAAELAAHVSPLAPPGTPGWAYLAAVLAERHQRALARLGRARAMTAAVWPELTALTGSVPWSPIGPPPSGLPPVGPPPVRPAVPADPAIAR
jgi:uncharacterized RDD family membrane protein YckC